MKGLFLLYSFAAAAWAQPVSVYSEFARIDAKSGDVIAPETPREILSPAVVRNGFTSFQVVVQAPAEAKWWLFVGQNPENAFKVTMYKESGDALERVDLPVQSEGTQVFWMDVWTDANAPVRRIKIEPELNLNDDWVIYPIEARVVEAVVPANEVQADTGLKIVQGTVCPLDLSAYVPGVPLRQLRNAEQDGELARQVSKEEREKLLRFCDPPGESDLKRFWTEGYLRIRDYLFRVR